MDILCFNNLHVMKAFLSTASPEGKTHFNINWINPEQSEIATGSLP